MMNQQSGLFVCRSGAASSRGPAAQWYCALALALLVLPAVHQPARSDQWDMVASGGLGDPTRMKPTALAVAAEAVYLATHDGVLQEQVFRAELRNDTNWRDVSPPWRTRGETRAMVSLDEDLWLSTSGGELWQRDRTGRWNYMTPSWARGKSIFALTTWTPPAESAARLVAAREGVELWWRRADGTWVQQGLPDGLRNKPDFVSGALQSFGSRLYLGVGGSSAGSTNCQVWRYDPPGWDAVTTDGFGRTGLGWVEAMSVFGDWLYIGTGGHSTDTVGAVFRTQDIAFEDVTPCDLYYGCANFPNTAPVRYGCLAATASQLFSGTRTPSYVGVLRGADVVRRELDGGWALSNTPGFGVDLNETTTGLAAGGASLYAATLHFDGFQVWRRNGMIHELLLDIGELRDLLLQQSASWNRCLRRRSCRRWEAVFGPMQELSLMFDTARNQQDDQLTIIWARQSLTGAVALLGEAKKLADRADKMKNRKKAALLRKQAAEKVTTAIDTAVEVCRKVGA